MDTVAYSVASTGVKYLTATGLEVTRLQPAIGAEISGIDLGSEIPAATVQDIRNTLLAHGVIFFRKQKLTYATHQRFAAGFGEIMREVGRGDRPDVLEVRARGGAKDESANQWHSDGCYMALPPSISILRSVMVPPLGGDTVFASATAAYADLSDEMKQSIAHLRYTASGAYLFSKGSKTRFYSEEEWNRRQNAYPEVSHPVVRVHPETGVPAIYLNESHSIGISGMDNDAGRALFRYLADRMKQPEYQVRWRWEPDSVAVWDNRAVQHYGVPDQVSDRHMERIMVAGTAPMSIADWEAMTAK